MAYNNEQIACLLSAIAYCKDLKTVLPQFLPGWNLIFNPPDLGGNYAFIASDGNTYALAIRGSELNFSEDAFLNWFRDDLNVFFQHPWPYAGNPSAMVAQGAWDGFNTLMDMHDLQQQSIRAILNNDGTNGKPIIITGHSLGGNLATVVASWLCTDFGSAGLQTDSIEVYTFAAPAAGNTYFQSDYDAKLTGSVRVENTNDIVPKFPVVKSIQGLSGLYSPHPNAANLSLLSDTISTIAGAIRDSELVHGSDYIQTNGNGTTFTNALSGNHNADTTEDWFAEAGYQHHVNNYCVYENVPPIPADLLFIPPVV